MATAAFPRYRVLEILDESRVIVSTRRLRRVIRRSTGEVLRELMSIEDARAYADGYNGPSDAPQEAVIVRYRAPERR